MIRDRRFPWPGLARPAEDHPEASQQPSPVLRGPRPDWGRPAEPLDPCGGPPSEGPAILETRP